MKVSTLFILLTCFSVVYSNLSWSACLSADPPDPCCPTQVHISLGDYYYNVIDPQNSFSTSNTSLFIVWQTQYTCDNTYVLINSTGQDLTLNTSSDGAWMEQIYVTIDAGHNNVPENVSGTYNSYSHTAMINGLQPGGVYTYQVLQTNGTNSAGPYTITLPDTSTSNNVFKLAVFADIDTRRTNDTLTALSNLAPSDLNMTLFLGDMGYDIFSESGIRGEYFFNTGQSVLAQWPFMITPGNHEIWPNDNYTFLNFRARMPLYNKTGNHYYSYNIGKVHFLSLEYYYYDDDDTEFQNEMYAWLDNDLKQANASRAERPWIVVYTHQPVYCSYSNTFDSEKKRCYSFYSFYQNWDELYYKYRVDFVLQGHVHYWERMGPIYQNTSQKYASWSDTLDNHNFINPQAPIYTVEGSAGNNYFMVNQTTPLESYSIRYDMNFAYSTLKMVNESAFYYEHVNSSNGAVLDYFYLLKGSQYPQVPVPQPDNPNPPPGGNATLWIILGVIFAIVVAGGVFYWRRVKQRKFTQLEERIVEHSSNLSLQNV